MDSSISIRGVAKLDHPIRQRLKGMGTAAKAKGGRLRQHNRAYLELCGQIVDRVFLAFAGLVLLMWTALLGYGAWRLLIA